MLKMTHRIGLMAFAMLAMTSISYAHCGTCGVGDAAEDHTHSSEKACPADCSKDCCSTTEMTGPATIGEKAPGFTLADASGTEHSLSDYKGKVVALIWADATCPFMVAHYKEDSFNKLVSKHEEVAFVMIDSNKQTTPESIAAYTKANSLKPLVLHDPTGDVGRAYGAKTTPHAYVIDKEGTLVYAGALDNAPMGKVRGGGEVENYVSSAIMAVQNGETPATQETKPYGCGVKYAKPQT